MSNNGPGLTVALLRMNHNSPIRSLSKIHLGRAFCLSFVAFFVCLSTSQSLKAGCYGHGSKSLLPSLLAPSSTASIFLYADEAEIVNSWIPSEELPCNGPRCRSPKEPFIPSMVVEVNSDARSSSQAMLHGERNSVFCLAFNSFVSDQTFFLRDGFLVPIEHPPRLNCCM